MPHLNGPTRDLRNGANTETRRYLGGDAFVPYETQSLAWSQDRSGFFKTGGHGRFALPAEEVGARIAASQNALSGHNPAPDEIERQRFGSNGGRATHTVRR